MSSPTRLPPPFFEKQLRPSSVWRASAANIMNESRSNTAAGSRTTVYFPGSMADRRFRPRRLVDGRGRQLRRVEQAQLVGRRRGPARARAVLCSRGQAVSCGGGAVVSEEALRARDGLNPCLRFDEPGRDQVLLLAQSDRGPDRRRTPLGRRAGHVVEPGAARRDRLRPQHGHGLRIVRCQSRNLLRVPHRALEAGIIELSCGDTYRFSCRRSP